MNYGTKENRNTELKIQGCINFDAVFLFFLLK